MQLQHFGVIDHVNVDIYSDAKNALLKDRAMFKAFPELICMRYLQTVREDNDLKGYFDQ